MHLLRSYLRKILISLNKQISEANQKAREDLEADLYLYNRTSM